MTFDTDLAVARLHGAVITLEDRVTVVHSPTEPHYHWGNYLICHGPGWDEASALAAFGQHFPQAQHLAIGFELPPPPPNTPGIDNGEEVILEAATLPAILRPADYQIRPLTDWPAWIASELVSSETPDSELHRAYLTARAATRARAIATGQEFWFAAYRGPELAASLGIVLLANGYARFQSVGTAPDHRRQGLASHLLTVAAAWANDHGRDRLVIVADDGSAGHRIYRRLGFQEAGRSYGWYAEARESATGNKTVPAM